MMHLDCRSVMGPNPISYLSALFDMKSCFSGVTRLRSLTRVSLSLHSAGTVLLLESGQLLWHGRPVHAARSLALITHVA